MHSKVLLNRQHAKNVVARDNWLVAMETTNVIPSIFVVHCGNTQARLQVHYSISAVSHVLVEINAFPIVLNRKTVQNVVAREIWLVAMETTNVIPSIFVVHCGNTQARLQVHYSISAVSHVLVEINAFPIVLNRKTVQNVVAREIWLVAMETTNVIPSIFLVYCGNIQA